MENKEIDIWRETPVRLLGYANECGESFRSAYMTVSDQINKGEFQKQTKVDYSHEGSLGNLCNDEISKLFEELIGSRRFYLSFFLLRER